jgi:hypothetical protein
MLGMRFKKEKKQTMKSKVSQPSKIPKKQAAKPQQKKQTAVKPKKIKQSPNPYQRFLESNKSADIEDLNKYFELRASRFNSSSIAAAAIGLSLFAVLLAGYYQGIDQAASNSVMLGNVVSGIFVGAAITLMVFLGKNILAMSSSNFDKNFGWYLQAKSHFTTKQASQIIEEAESSPAVEDQVEAEGETEIQEEESGAENNDEIKEFLSTLEKAAATS